MIRAPLRLTCVGLAACATRTAQQSMPPAPPAMVEVEIRLAQQGFGSQAHFAYCIPPICPEATPKSLPVINDASPDAGAELPHLEQNDAAPVSANSPLPGELHATVLFASNRATLSTDTTHRLNALLGALPPTAHLVITGYTDSTGPQHTNDRIAHARAHTVAAYLRSQASLSPDRTEIHAQGRCCYTTSNRTFEGRARNRRVEIAVASPLPRPF